jgi:lysophospholipase L1-like esterase
MSRHKFTRQGWVLAIAVTVLGQIALSQYAYSEDRWVATWAAAQQQGRPPGGGSRGGAPAPAPAPGTPPPSATGFNNQTIRMVVRTTIGGRRIRVQLSNAYGTAALSVGAAHVAVRSQDSSIVAGTDRSLQFSGKASVMIPPGANVLSDPVDLNVAKLSDLAISVFVPGETGQLTSHATGLHTTYIASGDLTAQPAMPPEALTANSWYFVSSIEVMAPANTSAIVAFGDSITDGATSTVNANKSWPSQLAERLASNSATANIAVLNEGISGNRILRDGTATNALARFDRDVLGLPGVQWLMLLEGINDIGQGTRAGISPADSVTADDIIGGMKQMIERAHAHGIKVVGCTLTPYLGASYANDAGQAIRDAVNKFIRTPGNFDAVVDFDKATQDPANPKQFLAAYNNTDHLHPNDAGYKAMADAVDLKVFTTKK